MRAFGFIVAVSICAALVACGDGDGGTPETRRLTKATYDTYRDEVLPDPAERKWEQIAWYPNYADGLAEAARQEKPVMLWVMNGHPLGCT